MIISEKPKQKKKKYKVNKLKNFYKYFFYTTSFIFLLVSFIFFNSEMFTYYKAKLSNRLIGHGITNYLNLPEILYLKTRGHFINNKKIILEMDFEEILKIETERNETILKNKKTNFSYTNNFNYFKATLLKDGKKIPIKIRLKGDRNIHWMDRSKSSYRIKIKGDERFNGLKVFSLQKPRARNYIYEWVYHQINSTQNDSINLKYEFFDLIINGENYGLYVLEEAFSKILLERNQKRDGPIFSVREEKKIHKPITDPMEDKIFQVYGESFWLNDNNREFTNLAYTKLTDTFLGKRAISETFDLKNLAWYVATVELLHTYHGLYLKSPKYYYNPLKGLFEVIPFDGHYINPQLSAFNKVKRYRMLGETESIQNEDIISRIDLANFLSKKLYEDEKFMKEYHLALAKISSIKFLDNFFDKKKDKMKHINSLIYADYFLNDFVHYYGPGLYYFDKSEVYKKAALIRKKLQIDPDKVIVKLKGNLLEVENYNLINPYLKIDKIYCGNNEINFQQKLILRNIKKVIKEVLPTMLCSKINVNDEFNNKNFQINFMNLKTIKVDTIDEKKFLKYFKIEDKKILLKNDSTVIDENITIPKDYTVIILPGQKITLKDNAFIYSLSNFIIGQIDNDKKVLISGNKDNYGGGLFINSQKTSQIFNTEFNFLSGFGTGDNNTNKNFLEEFLIYGSINFYNGHVIFKNTNFTNITSEDALNLINVKFDLDNINFHNISSDGVDVDFGNGSISNSFFNQIGNDAIDLSGSNSNIIKNYIGNAGDKGVSIGERSNVIIDNLEIVNSYVGVAVKDGSVVKILNSLFKNGDYGMAVYHKKNEYENTNEIYLKDVEMLNFKENIIKNKRSFINSKMNLKIKNYKNKKMLSKLYEKP